MGVETYSYQGQSLHTNGYKVSSSAGTRPIIDIRSDHEEQDLRGEIYKGLTPELGGEKRLPTLLVYDELGLKLFEEITYLDEYYPTNTEIEVLERYADDIAQKIEPDSILLELGSGNLRKVDILLKAIDRTGKHVEYYALDLSLKELERTLDEIPQGAYANVDCFGLHGTYDDGLDWLQTHSIKSKPKLILTLGSSIGNFSRPGAAQFVRQFAETLQPRDSILAGIDGCTDPDRVFHAYNDRDGVTHRFILNGLRNANRLCGKQLFDLDLWRVIGEYNSKAVRHQAFVSPTEDTRVDGVLVRKDEKVRIEESHKYTKAAVQELWHSAGVAPFARWANQRDDYALHMVSKKNFALPADPMVYAPDPVPTLAEWTEIWSLWDAVTRQMIPDEELLNKPIKLRNACIFYLGHIPTFFDMKLTDVTDGVPTDPAHYRSIFERGIDPDVDNPEHCHAHSEVPDTWPPLEEMLAYQERVRDRVRRLYDSGLAHSDRNVARALWLGYEHEGMHLETLLYMLVQSEKTRAPPNVAAPDFKAVAEKADSVAVANEWITVPENDVVIGLNDPESTSGPTRYFGWDIEKPARKAHVSSFAAKARPITIGEYVQYLQDTGSSKIPASWKEDETATNGSNGSANGHSNGVANGHANGADTPKLNIHGKSLRSVHGSIPLAQALHYPVAASYDELAGCAAWMGGRIPTVEEVESIYSYVDLAQRKGLYNATQKTIPAVNSQMVNEGVEETPPTRRPALSAAAPDALNGNGSGSAKKANGTATQELNPRDTYVDLTDCNVGFQKWCPTPVTQNGGRLSGRGDMGGVWEWTSSPLRKHEGYAPMPLYPAYSQDFFDEKHNIVLGGSWATVPRIAGRKTFVNWYQRNYPYVWAGARVVRDL